MRLTRNWLVIFSAVLMLLTSCQTNPRGGGIAIKTLCREWGLSLPTKSRDDTVQTQREIDRAYNVHKAVCEND